jgi:WD40 repeat protein
VLQWSIHNVGKQLRQYEYDVLHVESTSSSSLIMRKVDIALDGDGKHFLLPGSKATNAALLYHINGQKPLQAIGRHKQPVVCTDWHPIANYCLTGSLDTTLCLTLLEDSTLDDDDIVD